MVRTGASLLACFSNTVTTSRPPDRLDEASVRVELVCEAAQSS
jgi:hypothetical protein